jgi:peptidylprolyl isomerase
MSEVLAASAAQDWRSTDPENTLLLDLESGRVVIELAPAFAPHHVGRIQELVRNRYFDGLAIVRAQENYVVQWGDPDAGTAARRELPEGVSGLAPEFERQWSREIPFLGLGDGDAYAPEVGFSQSLPVGRDANRIWLTHCYGMVGAGRDVEPASGSGTELYVVIGHAPRHLDRNVTLVGRVLRGMEHLSILPRGTGNLGFYESASERVPIRRIRLEADVPVQERSRLQVLKTDTPTFEALIRVRRHRAEAWFAHSVDRIGLCNVPIPVRSVEVTAP